MENKDTVMYQGLFFEDSLCKIAPKFLGKQIINPHITFDFQPSDETIFDKDIVGKKVEVTVIGFGCDCNACGWLIRLPDNILPLYHGALHIHVTTSVSDIGKPVDTGNIPNENWVAIEPFKVVGQFGYFKNYKVVTKIKEE